MKPTGNAPPCRQVGKIKFFQVSSVSKEDLHETIHERMNDKQDLHDLIDNLTDEQMEWIAKKLGDSFCDCCYWITLEGLIERIWGMGCRCRRINLTTGGKI